MKGQLIGEGNTAEVFFWGETEILKLFRQKFPREGAEREYNVSKAVEKHGLPVPKVGQMIEIENRVGIIYEKIEGTSMLTQIMKHPMSSAVYARQMADLHSKMHECKILDMPKYKETIEWNIRHTDRLTEKQRLFILDLLEKLPQGEALCHGDFHPGNIMSSSKRAVVLDWMTATSGDPAADVARTILLLRDGALPEKMPKPMKSIIGLVRKRLVKIYLKTYLQLTGISKEEINQWRIPIIAARLTEWVPESEKQFLLNEINRAIPA